MRVHVYVLLYDCVSLSVNAFCLLADLSAKMLIEGFTCQTSAWSMQPHALHIGHSSTHGDVRAC
jgi:hypothetical protein